MSFRPSFLNDFFFFFFKKSYLFQLLTKPPYERFWNGILRFIFFSIHFWSQKYTLINIKVVSALVPERIFLSRKVIYFSCDKNLRMDGPGAKSCGLYFFPHMFGSQEYTLVNIKVVSALLPERIFFFKISYVFQLLTKPPYERFRNGILRSIFFSTHFWSSGVHPGQYKSRFGPRS